ncbi:MAG: M48 family metalloprotease [Candidatus Bathyarchaeota archaeon]|nr:M48 family metalloprotease [Candidatus Termiticorpusculum sp.]
MSFEGVVIQLLQPYFFYSAVFLIASFVCIKIFTRFCSVISEKTKSLLYLVPLIIPLVVMFVFLPSTTFQTSVVDVKTIASINMGGPISPLAASVILVTVSHITTLSITGILCLIGLAMGAVFALTMVIADDRIARRILRVIPLSADEQPWLQAAIAESSKKIGLTCPKIGIVEDLRPNAFTIGYGHRAAIVFSIGLLNLLDKEEITAVALHELAHVKHRDFFFKTLTSALTAISFFNPIAFITASTAQRQREMFADEGAITLLDRPSALSSALTKICNSIKTLPETSMFTMASTSLLVTSSILYRSDILAMHPRLDKRLGNISKQKTRIRLNNKTIIHAILLSVILITSFAVTSYTIVELQQSCYASNQGLKEPVDYKPLEVIISGKISNTMVTSQDSPVLANAQVRNENMSLHQNVNRPPFELNTFYLQSSPEISCHKYHYAGPGSSFVVGSF